MQDNSPESSIPIVAIGSSEEGLSSLEAFLDAVPPDFRACFLVAGNFPRQKSGAFLQRLGERAQRPVSPAEKDSILEEGRVWILAPGFCPGVSDREIHVVEGAASLPIDSLFLSLARHAPERSIAVVLSGKGSDGALGARELKECGGLVLVQSTESSGQPGMPQSVLLTGAADLAAGPAELASRLAEISRIRPRAIARPEQPAEDSLSASLRRLETLLQRHAGFNLGDYKQESVSRRIERRMGLCRVPDFEEYVALLQKNPAECENLAKDMLIGVTGFFRDPEVFARLRETVLPGLVKESRGRTLRIWVPGCSTGEEAYTIAMLVDDTLDDCGESGMPYKIFATDLDRRAVEIAGQGVYPESALAGVPEIFRKKYFTSESDGHHVGRHLREHMVFAKHNILRDPPFNRLDLISCRNLLIYLQPHAQHRVLSIIHFALRHGGVLQLGLSETVGDLAEDFGAVDHKQHIFHKKTASQNMIPETIPIAATRGPTGPQTSLPAAGAAYHEQPGTRLVEAFTDRILSRHEQACFVLNPRLEILYSFGHTRRHIGLKSGRASINLADLLPNNLSAALRTVAARVLVEEKPCRFGPIPPDEGVHTGGVTLHVESMRPAKDDRVFLIVFFEDGGHADDSEENSIGLRESMQRIGELEEELRESRNRLKTAVEELEASNEELQTSNEELQASNEELHSTNEELESVNEELLTLNNEHQTKVLELTKAKEDLDNFINSADIATLFLDPDLRIRLFTPSAGRHTGLLPHDIGRKIDDLSHPLLVHAAEAARRILQGAEFVESNLPRRDGKTVFLRATPFARKDGARAGATISLIPIASV